ncbi:MAG TPA: hypothetical protein VFH22_14850 [Rhodocyclaceae bacterium]|nr:hypothetical protein [Rhodocyclaceae bacterium]
MKTRNLLLGALLGSLLALPASAQMGGGMGPRDGMGQGPGMDPGTRPCADCGPGQRRARAFTFNHDNTPGWAMMSKEERKTHREKMLAFKSPEECSAYLTEHHQAMAARAKEQGKTVNPPRANACERMQARGMFK